MNRSINHLHSLDLIYIQAALSVFKEFILSDQITWRLSAPTGSAIPGLPDLSAGYFLLALRRIESKGIMSEGYPETEKMVQSAHRQIENWHSTWGIKCFKELRMRVRMWESGISDLLEDSQENEQAYKNLTATRVMAQLLVAECDQTQSDLFILKDKLTKIDDLVKLHFKPGNFIWDEDLRSVFPSSEFWYLYGTLEEERTEC